VKLALRIAIGALVAAVLGVALVPLLVLLDLGDGGTGWGLCDAGVATCRTSYFAGFELLAVLVMVLFGILGLIAVLVRLLRWIERRDKERTDPGVLVN